MINHDSGKERRRESLTALFFSVLLVPLVFCGSALADGYADTIQNILGSVLGIVLTVFQVIGVVLTVWSIGTLVMAFKNDDANSKTSGGQMLAVGLALVVLPTFISNLNLLSYITTNQLKPQ